MENKSILHEIKALDHLIIRNLFLEKPEYLKEAPTLTQVQIMGYLMKNENKEVYQNDLESVLNLRRATVSGVLKTMEKNGLIKRETALKDARTKKIILNEDVKKRCNMQKNRFHDFEEILKKDISENDLETFFNVLVQMQQNIKILDSSKCK